MNSVVFRPGYTDANMSEFLEGQDSGGTMLSTEAIGAAAMSAVPKIVVALAGVIG